MEKSFPLDFICQDDKFNEGGESANSIERFFLKKMVNIHHSRNKCLKCTKV